MTELDLTRFEAAAFDLDGTIVQHFYPHYCREAVRLFPQLGGPIISLDEALAAYSQDRLFSHFFPEQRREEVEQRFWSLWDRSPALSPGLIDGAAETLERLYSRGIRLALVTARVEPPEQVSEVLEKLGIRRFFHEIRCLNGRTHAWHEKETMLTEAAASLGVQIKSLIMFGDHPSDIRSALNCGASAAGVLTGGIDERRLLSAGALTVLKSISEIP